MCSTTNTCVNFQILLMLLNNIFSCSAENIYETDWEQNHYTVYNDKKVKWIDAFKNCQLDNSQLLHIDTHRELQFIRDYLIGLNPSVPNIQKEVFWTSGTDIYEENNFVWMTNGNSIPRTMWAPNQPDNHGINEHCIDLTGHAGLLLNDDICSTPRYYICKRSLLTQQIGNQGCNESVHKMMEITSAESQVQKLETDYEKYHNLNSVFTVLIFIALATIIVAVIVVKGEVCKILATQRTTSSRLLYPAE